MLSLLMAPFVPAFTYFLIRDRGMDSSGLGLMISVFSIGMVIGAIGATRLKGGRLGLRMLASTVLLGAGLAVGRLMPSAAALGALGLAVGGAWSVVEVSYVTIRLGASPEALLGRVATVAHTASVGVQPIGMLAGGLLIDRIGGGMTLAAMGLASVAMALSFGLIGSVRSARAEVAQPSAPPSPLQTTYQEAG